MAFQELKQDLIEVEADMRSYMDSSDEYLKLKIFKVLMRSLTSSVQFLLIGIGLVFALLFISFAASLALSETLDSYYGGFLIVAAFYTLIGILLYVFREKLNAPILKKFSKHYFD